MIVGGMGAINRPLRVGGWDVWDNWDGGMVEGGVIRCGVEAASGRDEIAVVEETLEHFAGSFIAGEGGVH